MSKKPRSPAWCTKPRPCDFDPPSSYCPHRECRESLVSRLHSVECDRDGLMSAIERISNERDKAHHLPADARLIAAAPDLLSAAKVADYAFKHGSRWDEAVEALRAAIAKAENKDA